MILFKTKIKSQALVLTIAISIVFFAILTGLFLLYGYDSSFVSSYILSHQGEYNLNSGAEIILSNPDNYRQEKKVDISDKNKVTVSVNKWGVYDIGNVQTVKHKDTLKRSFLIGYQREKRTALELYLTDSKLKLAGKTKIKGNVVVPYKVIERAYISGKPFVGNKLVNGQVYSSPKVKTKEMIDFGFHVNQNEKFFEEEEDILEVSFLESPRVLSGNTFRNYKTIKGHVIIESRNPVFIPRSLQLKNVIVKAPFVRVQQGFKGSIQVLAIDSINIEDQVELDFPSALVLQGQGNEKSRILIGKNCQINGVVSLKNPKTDFRKQYVGIDKGTEIIGQIHVEGLLALKGDVRGEVYAYKLISSTNSSVYYNTLIDVSLDASFMQNYAFFAEGDDAKILKYLE